MGVRCISCSKFLLAYMRKYIDVNENGNTEPEVTMRSSGAFVTYSVIRLANEHADADVIRSMSTNSITFNGLVKYISTAVHLYVQVTHAPASLLACKVYQMSLLK